jgi:G3E family GTPase
VARLDTMVTVVDASNLLRDYASQDFLRDRGETAGEGDDRTLLDLLVDQIEFADVVVINKVSDIDPEHRDLVRKVVVALNPAARIVETDFAHVDLGEVLDTGRFEYEKAHEHPLWYKELNGFRDHVPETEEYGISSFVYRARRPFHPEKFKAFTGRTWPGLIRAKGLFWLATRPEWVGDMSLAGAICRTEPMGFWWAAVPKARWPDHPEWRSLLNRHWAPVWGDRRQELVFIGTGMDEAAIRSALDECLVGAPNPARFDPSAYRRLPDPFPAWRRANAA